MLGDQPGDELDRAVSALQDPTRRAILLDFYVTGAQRTVDDVAKAAGVHRTVAFSHLERLVSLGYLGTGRQRGKSGKPAKLYRLTARPIALSYPVRRFELLSTLLATSLETIGRKGVEAARKTGRQFGAGLITQPARTVQRALDELAQLGSRYSVERNELVVAANCVFREACRENPHVVCALHAGLLEGALRKAGIDRSVQLMECHDAGCTFRLADRSPRQLLAG